MWVLSLGEAAEAIGDGGNPLLERGEVVDTSTEVASQLVERGGCITDLNVRRNRLVELSYVRPFAVMNDNETLALQQSYGLASGVQRYAALGHQLAIGRQPGSRRVAPFLDRCSQVIRHHLAGRPVLLCRALGCHGAEASGVLRHLLDWPNTSVYCVDTHQAVSEQYAFRVA